MAKAFPNTGVTIIDSSSDLTGFSPSEGLMVFQKDTNELKIYDGSAWKSVIDTDSRPNPFFRVRVSSNQNITAINKLPFNTVVIDTTNSYNTSTYIYTIPITGYYHFEANVFRNIGGVQGVSDIVVGSSVISRCGHENTINAYDSYSHSVSYFLSAGTSVYMNAGIGTTHLNSTLSYFSGYLITV